MGREKWMAPFETEREAKEYLVGRIVAGAKREGVTLTEIERKMLYFSETGWTLPNMLEVNAEFERDYNESEYELKVAGLIRAIEESDAAQNIEEQAEWDNAVVKLSDGDHYLLALISKAHSCEARRTIGGGFVPALEADAIRPPHDRLKLWITAFVIVFGIFGLMALLNWLFGSRFRVVADWILDRNRFGLLVLIGALIWVLGRTFGLRFSARLNRK